MAKVEAQVELVFSGPLNVRSGSKADIGLAPVDVRYSPKSGHGRVLAECPLCAKSRLMQCSKECAYSITSSARSRIDVGTDTLIALAVLRLSVNSKLVGSSTGKSDGFARIIGCCAREPPRRRVTGEGDLLSLLSAAARRFCHQPDSSEGTWIDVVRHQ
jgi:hypothetical protein